MMESVSSTISDYIQNNSDSGWAPTGDCSPSPRRTGDTAKCISSILGCAQVLTNDGHAAADSHGRHRRPVVADASGWSRRREQNYRISMPDNLVLKGIEGTGSDFPLSMKP